MTHWLLTHPNAPDAVCLVTDEQYDALLMSDDWPDSTSVKRIDIVSLDEFLQRARKAA